MPERFLLQILRKLVRSGVLKSLRGVEGGYLLARPAEEISLLDVYESFESSLMPSVPPLEGLSDSARQRLLESLTRVYAAARYEMAELKMSDLQFDDDPGFRSEGLAGA